MNRIKILREELNMTQQELADKLDGAKSTVAMYEKGDRKPSMEILIKLSDIFNCSIDYILGKSDIRNPEIEEDPLGLAKIGFSMKDFNPPTDKQREQLAELIKVVLRDNKKDKEDKS